jgi:hypothetical protein
VILNHVDENTYLFVISDHGIKPLREFEEDPHMHMDHGGTTPVIAKHDFADGDDVPGAFIAVGPGIKQDQRLMGFQASVTMSRLLCCTSMAYRLRNRCGAVCSRKYLKMALPVYL